jgi:outer membrane protein TolC
MSRHCPLLGIVVSAALAVLAGCHPQQPFYFGEDGDLSHYLGVATDIEYPDAEVESLADATEALRPFSLENSQPKEIWELTLEEAIHYTLANSKIIRTLGGQPLQMREALFRSPEAIPTVYDPAIMETDPRLGVEAALAAFDTQFTSSLFWEKNDTPRNVEPRAAQYFPIVFQQDLGSFQAQLSKTAATGGTWTLRHNVVYNWSVGPRLFPSDWNVNLEAEFRQPLLRGAGVQFNRIAGPVASPGSTYRPGGAGATPGLNNGVMIARINTDVALTRFEAGVRDLVSDVENAYWELYFAYRHLDAMITGRDFALGSWRKIHTEWQVGTKPLYDEAQARDEYLSFRSLMENALNDLYTAENNLRLVMGLAATDGRLIRPSDEPKTARVTFDWSDILAEALARSAELREEKWKVQQQELALIAAKNYLLPRLDAVGRYRWLGLGDDLIEPSGGSGNPAVLGSNAYQSMTGGDFQEWQFGLELQIPLGFRQEMANVRNAQLQLARERARLQDQELALSHDLASAIRQLEAAHVLSQTNFNRRIAARKQVEVMQLSYDAGKVSLDRVLDAQRRLAQAENDYYRSLVDYNEAIARVHYRKGSLLEYNDVYLSEGPWPAKAYFDARRRARARDAGLYLDYGYTRPKVISRGAYQQHAGGEATVLGDQGEAPPTGKAIPEPIPAPLPEPAEGPVEPQTPEPADASDQPLSSEPTAPQPGGSAAQRPQIGPGLTPPQFADAELAARQAKPNVAHQASVLQPLELAKPSGNLARQKPNTVGRWSAVRPTSGHEPVELPPGDNPRQTAPQAAPLKWSSFQEGDTKNESLANPPAAETDRPSSSWTGVQR